MKVRAVLVGTFYDSKLYYLLDPVGDKNSTGAIVDKKGNVEYVKFFNFVKSNPNIKELKFSKFHRFLWNAPSPENKPKWMRMFINGTQPVDEEMLQGAKIITELSPTVEKKQDIGERALQFKSMNASQNASRIQGSVLARSVKSIREKYGFKGIGRSIGNKPAIDGDGDGFVDDGLPTMRPFIPGFDFVLDAAGNIQETKPTSQITKPVTRGGMRSGVVTRPQTLEDRLAPISEQEMRDSFRKIRSYVEMKFNGGVPFSKKGEALAILKKTIPSFASGESYIEFLNDLPNDDDVIPDWARRYLDSFLLSIDAQPMSTQFNYHMRRAADSKSFEGAVGTKTGTSDYVMVDPIGEKYAPTRIRQPLIVFWYKEAVAVTPAVSLAADKRMAPFLVSSAISGNVMSEQLSKAGITNRQLEDLNNLDRVDNTFASIVASINVVIQQNPTAKADDAPEITGKLFDTVSNLVDIKLSPLDIDPKTGTFRETLNTPVYAFKDSKDREKPFIQRNILKDMIDVLADANGNPLLSDLLKIAEDARTSAQRAISGDNNLRKIQRKLSSIMEDARVSTSGMIAVHESNHMLQNIQAYIDMQNEASILRQKLIDERVKELNNKQISITPEMLAAIEDEIKVENLYQDLFVEKAVKLANDNIDLAKSRLLHADLARGDAISLNPESDKKSPEYKKSPGEAPAHYGWRNTDAVVDATNQMILKWAEFNNQGDSSLSDKQKLAKQAIADFLKQPLFDGTNEIKIGEGIARILNRLDAIYVGDLSTAFANNGSRFVSGENLNIGMVAILLNSALVEDAQRRNIFSGLKLRNYSALLDEVGLPDFAIMDLNGNGVKIQGLDIDESRKLSAAIMNMNRLALSIPVDPTSGMVSPSLSVRATTALRAFPDDAMLPWPFSNLTKTEFLALPDDTFIKGYKQLIDTSLKALLGIARPQDVGMFLEDSLISMNWWDKLSKDEIELLLEVGKRIGAPSIKAGRSGTGYAPYMGHLTPPHLPMLAIHPQFSEFTAEFAVAELFGVALSQIDISISPDGKKSATTRALSDNEIAALMKFMRWMYPNQMLGEKLESIQ